MSLKLLQEFKAHYIFTIPLVFIAFGARGCMPFYSFKFIKSMCILNLFVIHPLVCNII